MTTLQRQLVWAITITAANFIVLFGIFFYSFPILNVAELWNHKIMNVPFFLFAPSVSIVIGMIGGFIVGQSAQKNIHLLSNSLYDMTQGKTINKEIIEHHPELESIWRRLFQLQKQLHEQTKTSQKLASEKAEHQEKRIQDMINQERIRLARELHDSVSQQLFAASMMMSTIIEANAQTNQEMKEIKLVEHMIHQSQIEMRALLLHLRPVALNGKTLQEGTQELLLELSQKVPIDIRWQVEDFALEKGVEDHLFRILQESISNTLRHAEANTLDILLIQRDDFAILRVVDDGIGFDVDLQKTGSYGLQNMYERAIEIGGTLKMVSWEDKGTRIEVKVPLID